MNFTFIIFLYLSLTFSISAAEQVRVQDFDAPSISMSNTVITSATFTLTNETDGSEATEKAKAYSIYVPIYSGDSDNQLFYHSSDYGKLPSTNSSAATINIPLEIDNNIGDRYLFMAVEDGSKYIVVDQYNPSTPFNNTTSDYKFIYRPRLTDLCGSANEFCIGIAASDPAEKFLEKNYYLFLAETSYIGDSSIDPATNTTGFHLNIKFSNKVYADDYIKINSVVVGDKNLEVIYAGPKVNFLQDIYAFSQEKNSPVCENVARNHTNCIDPAAPLKLFDKTAGGDISGRIRLYNLTNNVTYNISLGFIDKFGFMTNISNQAIEAPLEIEVYINESACFLLSAGFQREHFVLNSFRYFRDQWLVKVPWGASFIDFYYSTAPHYTPYIFHSPLLSGLVKTIAILIYFMMHLFLIRVIIFFILKGFKFSNYFYDKFKQQGDFQ